MGSDWQSDVPGESAPIEDPVDDETAGWLSNRPALLGALAGLGVLIVAGVVFVLLSASPDQGDTGAVASPSPSAEPTAGLSASPPQSNPTPSAIASVTPQPTLAATAGPSAPPSRTTSRAPATATPRSVAGGSISNPIVIERLPFSQRLNVLDWPSLGWVGEDQCDGFGRHVWFSFRPNETMHIAVDAVGSNYPLALWVFEQDGSDLQLISCTDHPVDLAMRVALTAGRSYLILVTDTEGRFSGNRLQLNVTATAAPAEVAIGVDPAGQVDEAGVARIFGSLSCSRRVDDLPLFVGVRQGNVVGSDATVVRRCRQSGERWAITIEADSAGALFGPGNAIIEVSVEACDWLNDDVGFCEYFESSHDVELVPLVRETPIVSPEPEEN